MSVLKNNFYTVKEKMLETENTVNALVELNTTHEIYKGHFPKMPVVPGVLQIQIIKELLESHLGKKLQMQSGDNIKFMGMIIPTQNNLINFEFNYTIEEGVISCDAKLYFENTPFTKFKGQFKILN